MASYWIVRFADNGVDRGYRKIERAVNEEAARENVLRERRWLNEDTGQSIVRTIISVEDYTYDDAPYSEYNGCPGDVAARDSF